MKPSNDNAREHIVINEGADERDIPTREAFAAPEPERMVGADRGAWEDLRRAVASGSVRAEVAAIRNLHEAIFGKRAA